MKEWKDFNFIWNLESKQFRKSIPKTINYFI